ncbi:MAG: sugar ABC transporter permease [Deinococcales bacterium]
MRRFSTLKAFGFLAPFLAIFGFAVVYPVILGGYLSLFGQRGARRWWVGLGNYHQVITDPKFWEGFKIPMFLLFVQVPFMLFLGVVFALIYERVRTARAYRLIFYLPYAFPGIVAGLLWSYMFSKSMSPFLPILKALGVQNPELITYPALPWILLVIAVWEFTGYTSLILYATLLAIPKEYGEQAQLDGANYSQVVWYVKLPMLRNTLLLLLIFNIIGALQVFNEPQFLGQLITLPPNFTPAIYIYNQAFSYGAFTYAIAMGIVLAAIIFAISFFFLNRSTRELNVRA